MIGDPNEEEINKDPNEEDNDELDQDMDIIDDSDDDELIDIVIEIDDDVAVTETKDDIILSKHTLEGKHSLNYDSIFKGKKEDPIEADDVDANSTYFNDSFEVDKSSNYWFESVDNENYVKHKRIKERVYEVLTKNTDLNFLHNRRKPSKIDFNEYYYLIKVNLKDEGFSNVELFNELSVYFSDNLFNMFKLLDNKWRNMIIDELQDHIGKRSNSNEVKNRNIYEGTEIEFTREDVEGNLIHITGVVIETFYDLSEYKIDSYENIYIVKIEDITKILNNTKFKYNLNKLNNIDFL
jgi:hypothetical protein